MSWWPGRATGFQVAVRGVPLYRSREARDGRFADEIAACIGQADLHANFLISIREDAYSSLGDLFQSQISNVYGNYFHLGHLTPDSAHQAIEKPIATTSCTSMMRLLRSSRALST